MNELLLAILLPIILSGIAYGIAEILMKIFNIQHPKNTFFVYLLVFIIAFSFMPLTYMAVSEPADPESMTSSVNQISEMQNSTIQNISTASISSKITPVSDSNGSIKAGSIPSKYILEISWYDYIVDENQNEEEQQTTVESQPTESTNSQVEPSFITSFQQNLEKFPPIILSFTVLFLLATVFLTYHLFIGKKHYLKKINAHKNKNSYLQKIVQTLSKEINITVPTLYSYHGSPNAFVLGHPATLVISDRLTEVLTENELKTTIRHELTHIKHHDILLKAFIQAGRILCFYNPFVHLAAKKIFNKRELMADSSYNTSHGDKVSFMEALIKIAEYTQSLSQHENKPTPAISVSLLKLSSYNPTLTERFIGLFKQCQKKTILTILVSLVILFANGSAILFTHSFFTSSFEPEDTGSDEIVSVEEQYLVEDVTYATFYKDNQQYEGKMVHKTLYNVISLTTFSNNSNIQEIINYLILKYYQNQQSVSAF
ncbi:MAG: M56 family metallopeptidase [Candidatus Thermoplasmatota archaeon]|nr:M56 family metallopeptidase [Candidatus Thermoplasmatota archaeon]MBS3801412.1 M56 family metallopeptidase [Candidatus Thermoplasmatota archaeon]